jgi:hypothetical protein
MTTTLDPQFLRAVVLLLSFKAGPMKTAQAALLTIALRRQEFCAADLPGEICNGNVHLAGAATGSLIATGLLDVVRRVKSPDKKAKGRRLDVLRLAPSKESTVLTWFEQNGFPRPRTIQQDLPL